MTDHRIFSETVVFADRFYLSDKAMAELSTLGDYAFADAGNAEDLATRIGGSFFSSGGFEPGSG